MGLINLQLFWLEMKKDDQGDDQNKYINEKHTGHICSDILSVTQSVLLGKLLL